MKSKALAIYIHIPFCVKKCLYCDFLSAPATEETQKAYERAVCQEIQNYKKSLLMKNLGVSEEQEEFIVTSVFFGGGTPSLICGEEIAAILNELRHKFHFSEDVEITIECNPGTVNEEKLNCYRKAGINRLSFGLQSASNEELKKLGRIHTWEDFLESFSLARKLGFSNINIDLMSALPGQTEESYEQTLQKVLLLEPEHISAYSLIIEEGTPFYEKYSSGLGLPDEDAERMMYQRTKELLERKGYYRYEISNYAKIGYECRHNLCYWDGTDYIGFGLGASSMVNHIRYHNCSDLSSYMMQASNPEQLWEEVTLLSLKEQMEEFMFLGLRCMRGISINGFEEKFGVTYHSIYGDVTKKMEKLHLIACKKNRIYLTEKGIDVSNYVLSEFLIE